jgi:nucleoside-diphosphate-sugar epimerase
MTTNQELHVIFGTGPTGIAVMDELLKREKRVRMVNRSGKANLPAGVEIMKGDAADPAFTREASKGAAVIYNCTNPPYTKWPELFPALQAGVLAGASAAGAKLVVMENLYMYGETHGKPMTEDMPYAAKTRKGITRAKMAHDLLDAHKRGDVRVAIGRASDYFGPGAMDSAVGERLFYPALEGKTFQCLGKPDMPHTYTYMPDIGKGLVILGEHNETFGQAWHLPSPKAVTTRQFAEMVYAETGQPLRIQTAPRLLVQGMGLFMPMMRELAEMIYEFEEPFVVDHSKFAKAFGDHATPLTQAIRTTAKWFRENPQPKSA